MKIILILVFVVICTSGCVTLPNSPTFYSHQDLIDEAKSLDK